MWEASLKQGGSLASSPGLFINLRESGEKAWYRLQRACVITQRIHWIHYTIVFFCYMLRRKELRHCSLVEDGRKCVLRCRCVQSFCARLFSFNTYKEKSCRLWRFCTKGRTCLCSYRQGLRTADCYQVLPFVSGHKLGSIRSEKSIGVLVISPMVSLIVDHIQKLRDLRGWLPSSHPALWIVAVVQELQETKSSLQPLVLSTWISHKE